MSVPTAILIVLGEEHLRRILKSYADYCNCIRTHRSLHKDAPVSPPVQRSGIISSHAILGGFHHQYVRIWILGTHSGHTVGMCGDGANDAPALRQAQIGIAVSTATDVAKSAAGMVLTEPGLSGIVASVKEGRIIFQRILTYTLNSITKKVVQVLLLGVGLIMTGQAILTPLLMVLIMITGDFLGMSLTTDNVRPSSGPNAWRIGNLTVAGVAMGIGELIFCVSVLAFGFYRLGYGIDTLRTLSFVVIVFGNQATTYTNRERRRLWSSRPSSWLIASSVIDLLIASILAIGGIAMEPLPISAVFGTLALAVAFAILLDFVKIPILRRLNIA